MDSSTKSFFGIIEILSIKNIAPDHILANVSEYAFINMEDRNLKIVHYPDCQQLIIWLPQTGRDYTMIKIVDITNNTIVEHTMVSRLLNGEIQILIDTLPLVPSTYNISIDHKSGNQHLISLVKYEEGFKIQILKTVAEPSHNDEPIIYRDGFGNVIENEDIIMANKLKQDIYDKFNRRIEYEGNLRGGTITYIDGNTRIKFDHEMGGGNCLFFIYIPKEKEWENATGTPLSKRNEILKFVAETVHREKAGSTRLEITESEITYYH